MAMMTSRLFLDLDGVLADFDAHYERLFDVRLHRGMGEDPPGLWDNIRNAGTFYRDMPLMPDALELWEGVKHLSPTILTGVPYHQVPEAEAHKRAWMAERFGADVSVVCCKSRDKRLHGRPGDVLIDDWDKYEWLWKAMGGAFILHRTARESLRRLSIEMQMEMK